MGYRRGVALPRRDVLLQTAQQRGKSRAAADGHDAIACDSACGECAGRRLRSGIANGNAG